MKNPFARKNKQKIIAKNRKEESKETDATISKEAQRLINESKKLEKSQVSVYRSKARWGVGFGLVMGVIALCLGFAIAVMMPLKSVEPYVLRVDTTTGYTEVARPLSEDSTISHDEALARHFIAQYVIARESYDWYMATPNYNKVRLLSAERVFGVYDRFIRSDQSPLEVLGQNRRVDVTITNISFVGDLAQVRFRKKVVSLDGTPDPSIPERSWIATINYEFSNTRLTTQQRLINPLDFRVLSYNIDPESGEE